jgi:DNA-binding MarR family transcriptional regulator
MSHYDDCILYLFAKAYQKTHGNFKRHLQECRLTPAQSLVIMALWEDEGLSAGELGKKLSFDYATLSGILDRLADGGWIIKKTSEDDRRALQIYLTDQGRGMTGKILAVRDDVDEEILGTFNMEEKLLLKRMLKDLLR